MCPIAVLPLMRKEKQNLAGRKSRDAEQNDWVCIQNSTVLLPCHSFGWFFYRTSEERSRGAAFMKYPPRGSLNKDEGDTGKNVYPALLSYFNGLPFFSSQLSSND